MIEASYDIPGFYGVDLVVASYSVADWQRTLLYWLILQNCLVLIKRAEA
jgi:hypothetical protein